MRTPEEIKAFIKELGMQTTGVGKEIKVLPDLLREDENILGILSGMLNAKTWLVALTDKRVIFVNKGLLFGMEQMDTPLEKINTVDHSTGLINGHVRIWDGVSSMEVKHITKKTIKPFVDALNSELLKIKSSEKPIIEATSSSIDQLEKLHRLKESGALTDEEFKNEKMKLLA